MKRRRKASAGDGGRWSGIVARLADVWESPAPHVRQNLATLAATMADDPEALDALARMAADTAEQVVERRGQCGAEVLGVILDERRRMTDEHRARFDARLGELLAERWKGLDGAEGLGELLRTEFPLSLVPANAAAKAIINIAGQVPLFDRDQRDAAERLRQLERLDQLRAIEEGENHGWRAELRRNIAARLGERNRRDRRPVLLTLLRHWPSLVESAGGLPTIDQRGDVHGAASLGRGAFWPRMWRPLLGAVAAAGALMALILLTRAIQGYPITFNPLIGQAIGIMLVLAAVGAVAAWVLCLLYVPGIGRRLSPMLIARDILAPAALGSAVATLLTSWFAAGGGLEAAYFEDSLFSFVPLFLLLALTLANIHLLGRLSHSRIGEFSERWTILIAAAPALVIAIAALLITHLLDFGSANLFGTAIVLTVAAASGAWPVEEQNRRAITEETSAGRTAYRISRTAALAVAFFVAATIPLAWLSTDRAARIAIDEEALQRASANQETLQVQVPRGTPFRFDGGGGIPTLVAPQQRLFVRYGAKGDSWFNVGYDSSNELTDAGGTFWGQIEFENDRLCLGCDLLPTFEGWIDSLVPLSYDQDESWEPLVLIPAVRPGDEIALTPTPYEPQELRAGVPYLLSVAEELPMGGRIEEGFGYRVTRVGADGTETPVAEALEPQFSFVDYESTAPVAAADAMTIDPSAADAQPQFRLEPGARYRICVFWHRDDGRACNREQRAEWVLFPATARLTLTYQSSDTP